MHNLTTIGAVLVLLGIAALIVQNVSFIETKNVLDLGPIQVQSQEEHNLPIPTIAGIAAVAAGIGLIIVSRLRA